MRSPRPRGRSTAAQRPSPPRRLQRRVVPALVAGEQRLIRSPGRFSRPAADVREERTRAVNSPPLAESAAFPRPLPARRRAGTLRSSRRAKKNPFGTPECGILALPPNVRCAARRCSSRDRWLNLASRFPASAGRELERRHEAGTPAAAGGERRMELCVSIQDDIASKRRDRRGGELGVRSRKRAPLAVSPRW